MKTTAELSGWEDVLGAALRYVRILPSKAQVREMSYPLLREETCSRRLSLARRSSGARLGGFLVASILGVSVLLHHGIHHQPLHGHHTAKNHATVSCWLLCTAGHAVLPQLVVNSPPQLAPTDDIFIPFSFPQACGVVPRSRAPPTVSS